MLAVVGRLKARSEELERGGSARLRRSRRAEAGLFAEVRVAPMTARLLADVELVVADRTSAARNCSRRADERQIGVAPTAAGPSRRRVSEPNV